jgi:hypothetical protein
LTTILVVDEHGEGYPVAFCYSNHVDQRAMEVFFRVVRDTTDCDISDVVLMTDDAEAYSNAWKVVMGLPKSVLLCAWHIDRAWRKNLNKISGDRELKASVYKFLRTLLEERSIEKFRAMMAQFDAACLDDARLVAFRTYFNLYTSRPQAWAYCFRLGLHVHHNMHLEAMHRVLKHVYMEGRRVRRMDESIAAVMAMLRDKTFDRLLKLLKGKANKHVIGIRTRHSRAEGLSVESVSQEGDGRYLVQGSELYVVRKSETVPHEACVH